MHPIYQYIKEELSGCYNPSECSALAKWVLTEAFHFTASELYGGKDTIFPEKDRSRLEDIIRRLQSFEPLQYILGQARFCGLDFEVSPAVLIPRPETEELVEWIVSEHREAGLRLIDIGTGSGCIPVTLSQRLDHPYIAGWDISPAALEVARRNAAKHRADVTFAQVDVLGTEIPVLTADLLVSNPPYIAQQERADIQRNVLDWEPDLALFVPDDDPLLFYRRIAEIGRHLLVPQGSIYLEINQRLGEATAALLQEAGYRSVELRKDLSGNDRMLKAIRP